MSDFGIERRVLLGAIGGLTATAGCAENANTVGDDQADHDVELDGYALQSSTNRSEENQVRCWLNENAEHHAEARDKYDRAESRLASERYEAAEEISLEANETFEQLRDDVEGELEQSPADSNKRLFEELYEYLDQMSTGSAAGVVGAREGIDGNHGEARELLDMLQTRRDVARNHLREVEGEIGRNWEPIVDFGCVPAPETQIQLWLDDRLDRIEPPAKGFGAGHEAFAQGNYGRAVTEFETAEEGFGDILAEAESQLALLDEGEDPELFDLFEPLTEFFHHAYQSASFGAEAAEAAEAGDMDEAEELYAESEDHATNAEEYLSMVTRDVEVTL